MSIKIYIAGSSAEIDRAHEWHDTARRDGLEVISTWVDVIAQAGGDANPREASKAQRATWANDDLLAIAKADVFWFLVPPKGKETRGAWGELCWAFSLGKVIISSGDTKQSIFCALGDEYETDLEAYRMINL